MVIDSPDLPASVRSARRDGSKPSIYDVAAVAGVSHPTVSRVLNEHPNIRATTREKVLSAIEQVGYTRNSIARALATSRTKRIGVLVDAPMQFGPGGTVRGVEEAARAAGYSVSTSSLGDDPSIGIGDGVEYLMAQGVDAICVVAPRSSSLAALSRHHPGVPTLVIASEAEPEMISASVDQQTGAREAIEHLIALGHRRILHLAGPLDWLDAREREIAWRAALEAAGLEVLEPAIGDWTSDSGYEFARHSPQVPAATAIFVANDQMALGVLHGLKERGLRVPDDVSVVGFDDTADARHFLPPLTTVRQDFHALGVASVGLLVQALEGIEPETRTVTPVEFVRRESTGPVRSA